MAELTYITLEGIKVPYGPVSSKLRGAIETKHPIDAQPPTYKVETITDDFEEFPHDEESIKSEATTDEERAAWIDYLALKAEQTKRYNDELIRACILQGVKLSPPEDDSWQAIHRYLEIDIPTDPHDLKLFWLFSEVLKTEYDIFEMTKAILGAQSAYLEMRAVAASTFRGEVGKRNGADASTTDEAATEEQQGMVA